MFKRSGNFAWPRLVFAAIFLLSGCAVSEYGQGQGFSRGNDLDLSRYNRVVVDPVKVAFDKDWRPVQTGSHLEMSLRDRERLQKDIEGVFNKSFKSELGQGLELVNEPGPGVIRITPELVDVHLSAPTPLVQPGATFTRNVGALTLHLVFRDAASGEQLLELHDHVRGRDIGLLRPASPAYNRIELARIFEDWAQIVRQELFRAP